MKTWFFKQKAWLWPILIVICITPFTPRIDLALASYFYQGNGKFSQTPFYAFLYDYGVIPAQLLFLVATIVFLGSYAFTKWKQWRPPALILVLTLIIGSGVITHALLKDHWGRPRPRQVIEFGGNQPFRPYYYPNFFHQPEPSKSLACGHCTMGFYFFALAVVGRRLQRTMLFWSSLLFALTLGALLSWARMAQGGHFFSDTMISALVMWLTAYFCNRLLSQANEASKEV